MEEVVEDGCINRPDLSLPVVIVASLYLGTVVIVAFLNQVFNQKSVVLCKVFETKTLSMKASRLERDHESIKLLLLVSLSMLLHDDAASQVLEKLISELTQTFRFLILHVRVVNSFSIVVSLFILSEVITDLSKLSVYDFSEFINIDLVLRIFSLVSAVSVLILISQSHQSFQLINCRWIILGNLSHVFLSQFNLDLVVSCLDTNVGLKFVLDLT